MKILAAIAALTLPWVFIWLMGASLAGQLLLNLGFANAAAMLFEDPAQKGIALYHAERWAEAADAFAQATKSPANDYNRGNALAQAHRYEEALAAYEEALEAVPDDQDAAFNKSLLDKLIELGPAPSGPTFGSANSAASRARTAHHIDKTEGSESTASGDGSAGALEAAASEGAPGSSKASKSGSRSNPTAEKGAGQGAAGDAEGTGRTGGQLVDFAKLFQERERRYARRLEERLIVPTPEWLSALPDDPGRFLKLRILAEKARRHSTPTIEDDD